jgi:phage-related protein
MAVVAPIVSTFDNKGIRQAESGFDSLSGSASKTFGKIGSLAKTAVAAIATIGVAAGAAAFKAIQAASDLEEAQAKVGQIFGESARLVEEFASDAAKSLGQSKQAVLDAAGVFGTFGKAAGLGGNDLALFSNSFTALATDLASFNNTSPEEAVQAIGAALRGEAEPLRKYGVLLDDATLKAAALELGIYDGSGALTSQQKILAAQKVIWEQTTDAQGDFARTSKGLANQSRILRAQLSNITAEIGAKLLPIAVKIANFINNKVIPAFRDLYETFRADGIAGIFKKIGDEIKKAIPIIGNLLRDLGAKFIDWIQEAGPPALRALGKWIGDLGNWIVSTGIPTLTREARKLGNSLVIWIQENYPDLLRQLGAWLGRFIAWIVGTAIPTLAREAARMGVQFLAWTADLLPTALRSIGAFTSALAGQIPGLFASAINAVFRAGFRIGESIIDGMESGVRTVIGAAGGIAQAIASSIRNALEGLWNRLIAGPVNSAVRTAVDVLDALLGPTINFPPAPNVLPYLASGGIVDSPTLAVIGDRRLSQGKNTEAVIPLNKLDNMGGGITINVSGAIDPVATAKQIRRILQDNQIRLGYSSPV